MAIALSVAPRMAHGADPLATWTWRNPVLPARIINALAYKNHRFVAMGMSGALFTSPDGGAWEQQASGTSNGLNAAAYGNGRWVIVGGGGAVVTSTDAVTWLPTNLDDNPNLSSIAYGNGRFVVLGSTNLPGFSTSRSAMFTSGDGIKWVARDPGMLLPLNDVIYAAGRFVVAAGEGHYVEQPRPAGGMTEVFQTEGRILNSSDGITWTQSEVTTNGLIMSLAYGGGRFVAVGEASSGAGLLLTSPDGEVWASRYTSPGWSSHIAYGGGHFVTTYNRNYFLPEVYTSTDGILWTKSRLGGIESLGSIAYGGGRFVALGSSQGWVSKDGTFWLPAGSGAPVNFWDVAYGNGVFVAVGAQATILSSADGETWRVQDSGMENDPLLKNAVLRGVLFANGRFVVWGDSDFILASANGVDWIPGYITAAGGLVQVVFGKGRFVGLASDGESVFSSVDGLNWVQASLDANVTLNWVAYGGGRFVAVGYRWPTDAPVAFTSPEGAVWTSARSATYLPFTRPVYGRDRFAAVDRSRVRVSISSDGVAWRSSAPVSRFPIEILTRAGDQFAVLDSAGRLFTSPDGGTAWHSHAGELPFAWQYRIEALALGNGRLVAVGQGGAILESGEVIGLRPVRAGANGAAELAVTGQTGHNYRIESSCDLTNWTPLESVLMTNETVEFSDARTNAPGPRFYRAVSP